KIGKTLKVSPSADAKTIKRYKETGSHEDRTRKGIPGVTSAAEDKFIRVTSLRNRRLTAAQIRDQVNPTQSSSSRHISATTVKRRLCESGLHGRIAGRKPLLRTGNKQRLVWAKEHKEWTLDQWKSVLGLESKFVIFGSNHRVFVRRRKEHTNQHGYHSILQRHAIPSGLRLVGPSFFQQDNDPKHTSRRIKCIKYLISRSVTCDRQPPTRPNLRLIQYIWTHTEKKLELNVLEKALSSSIQDLTEKLMHHWMEICLVTLPKLIETIPAQEMYAVIKIKGGPRKY
uniref:Transposase Tc1-like domain-containing protein n=1 Tax=Poecilia formosa TaxID=48698 RepID=A0A096LXV4_POEFO